MKRGALLAGLLLVLAGVAVHSNRRLESLRSEAVACDALAASDLAAAIASEPTTWDGQICRALALLATGRTDDAVAAVEAGPLDEQLPPPALTRALIQARREEGQLAAASELARRAAIAWPEDAETMVLELQLRSAVEDEDEVLRELGERTDAGSALRRLLVAAAWIDRTQPQVALEVLGEAPDGLPPERVELWYRTGLLAQAALGEGEATRALVATWKATGADPAIVDGFYAAAVSAHGVPDPDQTFADLLADAAPASEPLDRPLLTSYLYTRWIFHLVVDGRIDDALAVYDDVHERVSMTTITRDAIARLDVEIEDGDEGPTAALRVLTDGPGELLVEGPTLDAAWTGVPLGRATLVSVPYSPLPLRWVFRDDQGVRGSGTTWPAPGKATELVVTSRPPAEASGFERRTRAGDGRRKVLTVILDCADWRITNYLRARGELPVIDAMIAEGWSGVLDSDPPYTAAAMRALVYPVEDRQVTTLGQVHELGMELAGLASIGQNPFAALGQLLPAAPDLFSTLGAGELAAGNMLFSHGVVEAGRHAEVVGPQGQRSTLPAIRTARTLDDDERARFDPYLAEHDDAAILRHLQLVAAEFDALDDFATSDAVDLMVLRVEPLDLLTHTLYSDASEAGQHDGERLLFEAYRYIDQRLGQLWNELDDDDVLVVVSDHGIRIAMEHDPAAMLVVVGDEVPHGRAEGRPSFRGLAAALAGLLGVETPWPTTGVMPWVESAAEQPK